MGANDKKKKKEEEQFRSNAQGYSDYDALVNQMLNQGVQYNDKPIPSLTNNAGVQSSTPVAPISTSAPTKAPTNSVQTKQYDDRGFKFTNTGDMYKDSRFSQPTNVVPFQNQAQTQTIPSLNEQSIQTRENQRSAYNARKDTSFTENYTKRNQKADELEAKAQKSLQASQEAVTDPILAEAYANKANEQMIEAQNERARAETSRLSQEDKITNWLDPSYKLDGKEKKEAKEIIYAYEATAKNPNIDTLTPEEKAEMERMYALKDKVSTVSAIEYALRESMPITPALSRYAERADAKNRYQVEKENGTIDDSVSEKEYVDNYLKESNGYTSRLENTKNQNPITYGGTRLTAEVAKNVTGQKLLEGTKYADTVGKLLGVGKEGANGQVVRKVLADALADMPVDMATDTLTELLNDISEDKSGGEIAKDMAINLGFNAGANVLAAGLGNASDIAQSGRKFVSDIVDNVKAKRASKELTEAVEDVAKASDDVVKEAIPPRTLSEGLRNNFTNKDIENILDSPEMKYQIENELGISLEGTKAEQRKALKDALTTDALAKEVSEVVEDVAPTIDDIASTTDDIAKPVSEVAEDAIPKMDDYFSTADDVPVGVVDDTVTGVIDGVPSKKLANNGVIPKEVKNTAKVVDDVPASVADDVAKAVEEPIEDIAKVADEPIEDTTKVADDIVEPTEPGTDIVPTDAGSGAEPPTETLSGDVVYEGENIKESNLFGTLEKNNYADRADEIDKISMQYEAKNNKDSMNNAKLMVAKDADGLQEEYISGARNITEDTDVDSVMLLIGRNKDMYDEAVASGDTVLANRLRASMDMLKRRLRHAATEAGQKIQAFAKWNRSAEGAIVNAERMYDAAARKYFKTHGKARKEVEALVDSLEGITKNADEVVDGAKRAKGSRELQAGLNLVNNNGVKETKKVVPKTLDQIKDEVRTTLTREMSSVADKFDDDAVDFISDLIQKKTPAWQLADEIEHFLKHGEFYEITEDMKVIQKESRKMSNILKNMDNKSANVRKEVVPKTHEEIVAEVKASFEKEASSIVDDFIDEDFDRLATMIEEKLPDWQIEDQLRHRLQHGEFYNFTNDIPAPTKQTSLKLQSAFAELVDDGEKVVKEKPTFEELKAMVENTIEKEYSGIASKFEDADIDYIANLMDQGATKKELTDALKCRLANGVWDVPEDIVNEVNELFSNARKYGINDKRRVDLETEAFWLLANSNGTKSTLLEKFDAWRYLAMLGNPKTHIRNIIGNKLFRGVTGASDTIAAIMESGADKVSKNGIERTKAVLSPIDDAKLISASKADAMKSRGRQLAGSKWESSVSNSLKKEKDVFDNKLLQRINKLNSDALEAEDVSAMKKKYATSLAGYLKANGLDETAFEAEKRLSDLRAESATRLLTDAENAEIDNLSKIVERLEKGRDYAVKKAEYAAFHEDNAVAEWLSKFLQDARQSDSIPKKVIGRLGEGVMPFVKTPMNVLRSGLEYSPMNVVQDAYKAAQLAKGVEGVAASDLFESMSKTITGTTMVGIGAWMQSKGIINISDEDTKWQDSLEGIQNYSIRFPLPNGKEYTATIDFAAPFVMPILLGAEAKKVWDARSAENGSDPVDSENKFWDSISDALKMANRLMTPITETSMMSSFNDTLNAISNGDALDAAGNLILTAGTSYFTQAIPTVLGQVARTIDNTRRSTYSDETGLGATMQKRALKLQNKIPGLSFLNEPYINAYGQEEKNSPTDNILGRLAYQMFSPSYIQEVKTTDVDTELRKLYKDTGGNSKFAGSETSIKYPGVDDKEELAQIQALNPDYQPGEKLSRSDYTKWARAKGTSDYGTLNSLFSSDYYNNMGEGNSAKKAEDVDSMLNIGKKVGISAINPLYDLSEESGLVGAYGENKMEGVLNSLQEGQEDRDLEDYIQDNYGIKNPSATLKDIVTGEEDETARAEKVSAYKEVDKYLQKELGLKTSDKLYKELIDSKSVMDLEGRLRVRGVTRESIAQDKELKELLKEYDLNGTDENLELARQGGAEAVSSFSEKKTYLSDLGYQMDSPIAELYDTDKDAIPVLRKNHLDDKNNVQGYQKAKEKGMSVNSYVSIQKELDADRNGSVKKAELLSYLNSKNANEAQMKRLYEIYGNGYKIPVLKKGVWK